MTRLGRRVGAGAAVLAVLGGVAALLLLGSGGPADSAQAASAATPEEAVAQWASRVNGAVEAPGGGARAYDPTASPGALQFPAGTSYEEAMAAIYLAQVGHDALPPGVQLVASLPEGKVLIKPTDGSGVTVDLSAPYGWFPQTKQFATAPTLSWPRPANPAELEALNDRIGQVIDAGGRWWAGARISDTTLPACEVMTSRAEGAGPACGDDDYVEIGRNPALSSDPLS